MKVYNFLFILLFGLTGYSQNSVLSAIEYSELQNKVRSLSATNVDSALIVSDKIEKSNSNLHKSFAKSAKGYLYKLLNNSKKSDFYFKEAFATILNENKSAEKQKTLSYIYNFRGASEWYDGNFKEALFYYQKGEKISKEINDKIQLTKFNTNIALLNGETENYSEAISRLKMSDEWIDENKELYDLDQFLLNKSNTCLNLGRFYEAQYHSDPSRNKSLDSALIFFKKALNYSENFDINRVKAKNSIGNIYLRKKEYNEAEKVYQSVIIEAKEKKLDEDYGVGLFNLASLYYGTKEYDKSLVYLKKVDSIYLINGSNVIDYINSNYIQSKIYESKADISTSLKHAEIYLSNFEKDQNKKELEKLGVNNILSHTKTLREMKSIKEKYGFNVFFKKMLLYGLLFVSGVVFILFLKNKSEKKKIERKFEEILNQHNNNQISKEKAAENYVLKNNALTIDEVKENEILSKLELIIEKEHYLMQDFTLQYVAKKIKTNTTYLSYVVNNKYGKTFSEYTNELKINYVINRMITDSKYRKYSTQAIAESVGFKNATSFTRSFSKRTGLSPVQFAQKLN